MKIIDIIAGICGILCLSILFFGSIIEVEKSKEINKNINNQLSVIQKNVIELRTIIESGNQIVTVSAYHPKSGGINSDSDSNNTAIMKSPVPGWTCAISDDLFKLGWLGKKIYIDGKGVRYASDRMDKSVTGKQIDICAPSLKYANEFGIKKGVRAIVLN